MLKEIKNILLGEKFPVIKDVINLIYKAFNKLISNVKISKEEKYYKYVDEFWSIFNNKISYLCAKLINKPGTKRVKNGNMIFEIGTFKENDIINERESLLLNNTKIYISYTNDYKKLYKYIKKYRKKVLKVLKKIESQI